MAKCSCFRNAGAILPLDVRKADLMTSVEGFRGFADALADSTDILKKFSAWLHGHRTYMGLRLRPSRLRPSKERCLLSLAW